DDALIDAFGQAEFVGVDDQLAAGHRSALVVDMSRKKRSIKNALESRRTGYRFDAPAGWWLRHERPKAGSNTLRLGHASHRAAPGPAGLGTSRRLTVCRDRPSVGPFRADCAARREYRSGGRFGSQRSAVLGRG